MASTGRARGPASRPPRRPSVARPSARGAAGGTGGAARSGTTKGSATSGAARTGKGSSRPAGAASTRATSPSASGRTSTTGAPTTAKVVRRSRAGWGGRLGGAVTHRFARRGAVLLSIAVFLAVLLGSTVAAWFHQRSEIAALRDQVAAQEQDVADLRAERERWSDPAYVEQQARQRLKFVRPGERSYTVLDPVPESGTDEIAAADVVQPRANLPWFETVWESARTADAPGARR
jgi:cell division protein FtsB